MRFTAIRLRYTEVPIAVRYTDYSTGKTPQTKPVERYQDSLSNDLAYYPLKRAMELKLYQIVIGIIAIFMIHQGGKIIFAEEITKPSSNFRSGSSSGGGMTAIVIFPNLTNLTAEIIGIQDNVNAAILAGFILVFLMVFKLSAIERLEQQISILDKKRRSRKSNNRIEKHRMNYSRTGMDFPSEYPPFHLSHTDSLRAPTVR